MAKRPPARKLKHLPYGLGLLHRNAVRRGLLGGRNSWVFVGMLIWIPRAAWRFLARHEHTVARDVLYPGQSMTIQAFRAPSKKELKQAKKAAKQAK